MSPAVCHGCERPLFDANNGPAVPFAAVVKTRARPVPGIAVGGRFHSVTEYPCVCSRACLAKVKDTWPSTVDPAVIDEKSRDRQRAYRVDGETLTVMWTFVLPDEPR